MLANARVFNVHRQLLSVTYQKLRNRTTGEIPSDGHRRRATRGVNQKCTTASLPSGACDLLALVFKFLLLPTTFLFLVSITRLRKHSKIASSFKNPLRSTAFGRSLLVFSFSEVAQPQSPILTDPAASCIYQDLYGVSFWQPGSSYLGFVAPHKDVIVDRS